MKKNILSVLSLCAMIGFSGCNSFLELEPLDKVSGNQLTQTTGGLKALLANIYTMMPMEDFTYRPNAGFNQHSYDGVNATTNIAFYTDEATRSDGAQGIGPEGFNYWPYSDIRQVNIFMENITKAKEAGTISTDEAERLTSEAHFIRAYIYFGLAKRLGGVPLIDHVQDSGYVPGDPSSLSVPRSTELETWKFVLKECDLATAHLPETVSTADGVYRASKWAAYALKSRAALFAASVAKYWNRAPLAGEAVNQKLIGMDASEADYFYGECIAASEAIINNSGKSLYKPNPASKEEAMENYKKLFLTDNNEEVIFAKAYLDGTIYSNQGHSYAQSYILSQVNTGGALKHGRFNPTLDIVDLYEDYTDDGTGKSVRIVTRTDGKEVVIPNIQNNAKAIDLSAPYKKYDDLYGPFENKDIRLLAGVIVPGSNYGSVKIIMQGGMVKVDGSYIVYSNEASVGRDGKTYFALGAEGITMYSGYGAVGGSEDANFSTTGFSIRKYMPEGQSVSGRENSSTMSYIDMRLSEIYLNYAEAVVENGSGKGDAALAKKYMNALRKRAAHTDEIPLTLENVLKERRIELAFEGQRYWDLMRRREFHTVFNQSSRTVLVPMIDLREQTPKYIFVRANFFKDELSGGYTFQPNNYYRSITGVNTNGLVQNPGY